jgi:F0F1-type ATP synthase membrane subunit c/vacuolar-type H+-ATPase subunit K
MSMCLLSQSSLLIMVDTVLAVGLSLFAHGVGHGKVWREAIDKAERRRRTLCVGEMGLFRRG